MYVVKFSITTSAAGAYTSAIATAPGSDLDNLGPKLLYAVEWVDGTLDDGVDAVLSVTATPSGVDKTLLTLTNANDDAWYHPRGVEHDAAGAALTTRALSVVYGTLKLVVSAGGNVKTGACWVYLLDG